MPLTLASARHKLLQKQSFKSLGAEAIRNLINEACEVLDTHSRPKDSLKRAVLTAYDETLTLPRQCAMLHGIMRNSGPMIVRNGWFEFVLAGSGSRLSDDDTLDEEVIDMGDGYCCFREPFRINADGCRLKIYTDAAPGAEVAESIIEIYGVDADGNPIRTSESTSIREGEAVALLASVGYVTTDAAFAQITKVTKPITNGRLTMFAVDPDTSAETLIAIYEPSEELPQYRRYKVPPAPDGTDSYSVPVLYRSRFIEAVSDNDFLAVDNFAALVSGMLHIQYRDANDDERAARMLAAAKDLLSKQAIKFNPASQYPPPMMNLDELENRTYQGF